LGYPSEHRGYRCYDSVSRRILTSRHVYFDETHFPFRDTLADSSSTPSGPTPFDEAPY
jgi:hypothetical protein